MCVCVKEKGKEREMQGEKMQGHVSMPQIAFRNVPKVRTFAFWREKEVHAFPLSLYLFLFLLLVVSDFGCAKVVNAEATQTAGLSSDSRLLFLFPILQRTCFSFLIAHDALPL